MINRCKAAKKEGAADLEGKGADPARYDDQELRDHLFEILAAPIRTDGAAVKTTPAEDLQFKQELVAKVKATDTHLWHEFCSKSWGKFDPTLYPVDVLLRYLEGKEPPTVPELVTPEIWTMAKSDLVIRCKMAVKQGAQALEVHGRDPARYSEEELREYLAGLNPDLENEEEVDGILEEEGNEETDLDKAVFDRSAEEDGVMAEVMHTLDSVVEEAIGDDAHLEPLPGEPGAWTPGVYAA